MNHRYKHWLAKLKFFYKPENEQWAFTLGQSAYYKYDRDYLSECNARILESHEEIHMEQYERYGVIGFLWRYFILEWNVPYLEKSLEQEAFEKQIKKEDCYDGRDR